MNVRKYLQQARASQHEGMLNADGRFDDDLAFTGEQDFFPANGMAARRPAPTSQPYIITVTSTSGAAVNNFEILGSYEYLNNAGFTAGGDLVIGSITISSGISGVTYREFLYQCMNNPFSVGLTYIQSTTSGQILETVSLNTKDANGNEAQKTIVPTVDPYQNQSDVIAVQHGYRIDGYTKMIIRQVLANATVKFYLYPADNINLARGLNGAPVSRGFGNPGIVREQVKVVGGDSVATRLG